MGSLRSITHIISNDTICAISTPPGVGGIAVVRVSGPQAAVIVRKSCSFLPLSQDLESHRAYFGTLRQPESSLPVDEVVVTHFAQGRSYTGEQTLEISCHGGRVVPLKIIEILLQSGCRIAQKGEFSLRAFFSGRLDLVQAEAVLSLIESQSERSARAALRQLKGHLSQTLKKIEDKIIALLAHLEASIDFETEGIELESKLQLRQRLNSVLNRLEPLLESYQRGRLLAEGMRVVFFGKPNVGKSSLFNSLMKEEKAIVTDIPGTTRDVIEGRIFLDGIPVSLVDTAGLRESSLDPIEKIGMKRAQDEAGAADLVLHVLDLEGSVRQGLSEVEKQRLQGINQQNAVPTFVLVNKIDLDHKNELQVQLKMELQALGLTDQQIVWLSAHDRDQEKVRHLILDVLRQLLPSSDSGEESISLTQARHFELLAQLRESLLKADKMLQDQEGNEWIAFEVREGLHRLQELLGHGADEDVIDRIFKEFCIGK